MAAEATAAAVTTNKAGFWIRTFAYIIDAIGIGIVSGIVGSIVGGGPTGTTSNGLSILIGLVYFVYFWSQGGGQTLGMRVLDLKVIRTDGSTLTLTQALIRYVGLFVSFACLAIGVIWVAFDANKQGWHDKIADTYVVKAK